MTVRGIALPARRTVVRTGAGERVELPGQDSSGTARGCTCVDPALTRALATAPASLQVDSAGYPAGALRGPLLRTVPQ
ncbi:hypothetical protein, partial [Staphylococcus saprophyticus]|uniref:hypothetical protein n=1 Tax=Staphylococcus saprophyticus TaxID=29385 RepID=UPI0012ADB2E8